MNCEQCGRPALALVRTGKKRSRKAKAGQPRKIKDHSLCAECWEKQGDSWRTSKAMEELTVTIASCKGCREPCHAAYVKKYDGYCFECHNRGAPERDEMRSALERIAAGSEPRAAKIARDTLSGKKVAA